MSYRDPRDPRTARYEPGYAPESRAYGRPERYPDREQGNYRDQSGYPDQPGYTDQPTHAYSAPPRPAQRYDQAARYDQADRASDYDRDHQQPDPQEPARRAVGPDINVGMFVGGVVMTGVVTGLSAWLVAWIIRAIAQRVNEVGQLGVWNPVAQDEYWFGVVGFLIALVAGALWYVLQIITPSPGQFFRWIVALLIAAAVIIPLVLSRQVSTGIGTAVMHLVIGLPVFSLIPAMGQKSSNR
ncbi:MAG: hypothetical protein QM662_09920 [Gordonia sp. (in: high G+C Gram-positive bacteria)]